MSHNSAGVLQATRGLLEEELASRNATATADTSVVTIVTTAYQLRDAIRNGIAHIELRNHLDLVSSASPYFGAVKPSFKTFRVRF